MLLAFELGIELTFPAEESVVTGALVTISQIVAVLFAVLLGYLNLAFGCHWALASQIFFLLIGTVATAFVPNNLKRQEAFRNTSLL